MQHNNRPVALVTGASSGLGVDFARQLAERDHDLVLVARREQRLLAVRDEISAKHGVEVHVVPMSLSAAEAPNELFAKVREMGLRIDVLINNAGFGLHGRFLEIPWEREREMLELDILTVVALAKLFGADMVERGSGRILNVSSIGAFQPTPTYASYCAAKRFVLNWSEAIAAEWKGSGVTVSALCPGITRTEFLEVSGQEPTLYERFMMMESPDVVRSGLAAMFRGRPARVPGLLNSALAFLTRFTSRRTATRLAGFFMTYG